MSKGLFAAIFLELLLNQGSLLAASPSDHRYDFSTLSGTAISGFQYCEKSYQPDITTTSGHQIKMLGAALVYASPANGHSIMGHVAERFVFCRDGSFFDVVYDYAPFDPSDWNPQFESIYGVSRESFNEEQKKNLFESLFVRMHPDPAQLYSRQQFEQNRTVYEAWFDLDGPTTYRMMISNVDRYFEQLNRLQNHEPLPPYHIPSDDCLTPVKKDYELINPGYVSKFNPARLTPSFFYDYVRKKKVNRIIMYPSQRQFRQLRLRAEGKSTAFQWFLPTSKISGGYPDSWALIFPGTHKGLLNYFVFNPLSGAVNFLTGVSEVVYGALTIPLNLLGKLPGLEKLYSHDRGIHRFTRGWVDLFHSTLEAFSFQLRYPIPTEWTEEEKEFFQNFAQDSVLLKYLGAKFNDAPLLVNF